MTRSRMRKIERLLGSRRQGDYRAMDISEGRRVITGLRDRSDGRDAPCKRTYARLVSRLVRSKA